MTIGRRIRAFLELIRPANVVTAFADILAGAAAAGVLQGFVDGHAPFPGEVLMPLLVATTGLYAGGVVLNDVFDAKLDGVERPERPIPSGRVKRSHAAAFGALLLAAGVAAAGFAGIAPLLVAGSIAAAALLYDAWGKHRPMLGPINMGLCRGGNLLLGTSAVPGMLGDLWFLGIIPLAYIGAVTILGRGEVHGGRRSTGVVALILVGAVVGVLALLYARDDYRFLEALAFWMLFAGVLLPTCIRAVLHPSAERLRRSVKLGVLWLIVLDATLTAGFAGWLAGLGVLILLPLSLGLAKWFAVT